MAKSSKSSRKETVQKKSKPVSAKPKTGADQNLKLWLSLILFALAFLLYAQTLEYAYTLDDFVTVTHNQYVQKGFAGIPTILQTSYWQGYQGSGGSYYRPMSLVLFAMEWGLSPNNPSFAHLVNVLLYAFTAFVLFNLLYKLTNKHVILSFITTLLFIAHPVHTEVVANIKSADELLGLLFCLISMYWLTSHVQTGKSLAWILSTFSFFLALLSKESALTFFAVIPFMLFVFQNQSFRKILTLMIPYSIAVVIFFLIKASFQGGDLMANTGQLTNNILTESTSFVDRAATSFFVLGKYVWLLVFPYHLSIDYSYKEIDIMKFSDYRVLVSFFTLLALGIYALFQIRKKDLIAFGILYFFITISLVSNLIIVIGTIMGDRLLYMPSLGFSILLAFLLLKMTRLEEPGTRFTSLSSFVNTNGKILLIAGLIFLLYAFKTVGRNTIWKDNLSLFQSGIQDAPNSGYIHYLLGNELANNYASIEKDPQKRDSLYRVCLSEYNKAIAINPKYTFYYVSLVSTYHKLNMPQDALKSYDLALKYEPQNSNAFNGKGVIYFEENNFKDALTNFSESARLNGTDGTALKNLAGCYLKLGDNDKAIEYFNKSIPYLPNHADVLKYIGYAYQNKGDNANAEIYFAKAKQAEESKK